MAKSNQPAGIVELVRRAEWLASHWGVSIEGAVRRLLAMSNAIIMVTPGTGLQPMSEPDMDAVIRFVLGAKGLSETLGISITSAAEMMADVSASQEADSTGTPAPAVRATLPKTIH